ncbi:MAG: PAS domain S-box protein, partial [Ramlibacter sp.]
MDRAPNQLTELARLHERLRISESRLDIRDRELAAMRTSHELLVSTLDSTSDGILTLQYSDNSMYYNIRFVELWGIPEDRLSDLDSPAMIAFQAAQVKDPDSLVAHIEQRRNNPDREDFSVIEMLDGRVLERHVIPQRMHGQCVGSVITFRDVTERLRHEEKMMFNHLVLENSGPMLWIDGGSGRVSYANPAACRHLGYPIDELLGTHVRDFDKNFSSEQAREVKESMARNGPPVVVASQHRRKDGTLRDVEVTISAARNDQRAVYITSFHDTTAQNVAQQAQKRDRQLLDNIVENLPTAVQLKSVRDDYRLVMWNKSAEDMYGLPRSDAIGRNVHDIWDAADASRMHNADLELVRNGGMQDFPDRPALTRHRGEIRVHMRKVALYDETGEATHVLIIADDITEQKRAAAETKRQEFLLKALIDSIPDIIIYKDVEGVYLGCNEAFCTLSNRPASEIIGRKAHDLFPSERADIVEANDAQTLATLQRKSVEEWLTYPDGTEAFVQTVRNPLRDPDGKVLGVLGVGRNITKRKQAETELARQQALLLSLINSSPDIIAYRDLRGVYLGCNAVWHSLHNPAEIEIVGKRPHDVFPKARADFLLERDREVLDTQRKATVEEKIVDADGVE